MKGPEQLKYFQENWPTNKGAWFPGEKVHYREKLLFDDFQDRSWMTLFLYGITGRMPTEAEASIVEKFWTMNTSFPDPRIWNNRVVTLAGTSRSTGSLAIAAATAISEAKLYGAKPVYLGALFLQEAIRVSEDSDAFERFVIDKLKKDRYLPGFGRPVISADERITPFYEEIKKLGFDRGDHIAMIPEIENLLQKRRFRIRPNIAIYGSALFSDLGFTPYQCYLLIVLAFNGGFFPCYIDALEKKECLLFPLDCHAIQYTGHNKRKI